MNFIEYLNQLNTNDEKIKLCQIRTNICTEELKISEEEKVFIKNEVNEMLSEMSYEEINEIIINWIRNPYGTDVDAYRISLLENAISYYHAESINQKQKIAKDKIDIMYNQSYKLAKNASKCR